MSIAFEKSFASFDGVTSSGKKKVECWSDRNDLNPREVSKSNNQKFWFVCDRCGHDFESCISDITRNNGTWCPYCANQKLCNNISCNDCFEKSFASFDGTVGGKKKVDCWSDRNDLNPREVYKGSNKKFWFDCDRCGHDFDSSLYNITKNNRWCPYCADPCQKLCSEDILCYHCYNNSFASFDGLTPSGNLKTNSWSDRNELNPREVCKGSHKKYWFDCDRCGHDFESCLSAITKNNGTWCPYCANQKLCNNISCNDCFEKSFASFDSLTPSGNLKTDCWSDINDLNPREVSKCTHKKFWFVCDRCGHDFDSALNNITCSNRWCPYCADPCQKLCSEDILCYHCYNNSFASCDSLTLPGHMKIDR